MMIDRCSLLFNCRHWLSVARPPNIKAAGAPGLNAMCVSQSP